MRADTTFSRRPTPDPFSSHAGFRFELELELIQTQLTQKPMLRAEGECACVAQMERAKIKGVGGQVPYKELALVGGAHSGNA